MQIFRRILFTVASVLVALLVIFWLFRWEENRRGVRDWATAQRMLRARGESLDWSHFVPPPVPDGQNLAFAPFYVRALHYQVDPKTGASTISPSSAWPADLRDLPFGGPKPARLAPMTRSFAVHLDLAAYAAYFRTAPGFPHPAQPGEPAADVLLALTRYGPALDELARAAAERPLTRFPINWEISNPLKLALPHYNLEQQLVTTLALRASARLAAHQPADALRDLELCFRLCHDASDDPVLIAQLVQFICVRIALVPVWEGLADRRWSGPELARLQRDLQTFHLLADYQNCVRGERASYGVRGIDYLSTHLGELPGLRSFGAPTSKSEQWLYQTGGDLAPRGWYDENKAVNAFFMQDNYIDALDPARHRVFPAKYDGVYTALAALPDGPTTFLLKNDFSSVFATVGERAARVQVSLDEATVACALERFALDHPAAGENASPSSYPATLAELVPAYLDPVPVDLIDGAPLRYVRTPDGRYHLYSVGWNGRDDGGQPAWSKPGVSLNEHQGDWVWQYDLAPPPTTKSHGP